MTAAMKKANGAPATRRTGERVDVRATAVDLLQEARRLGAVAESQDDVRTAVLALDRAARALELVARVQEQPEEIDFARHPRFVAFRDAILGALQRHPEAMADVMAALESPEGGE